MALRNFTRHLHMFLEIFELCKENKKNCLGKTVLKMWSQICEKMPYYVQQIALKKKCAFKFLRFMCFYFFALFFKLISCTNTAILPKNWDNIFKTVFPSFLFCFLWKAQKCLETCVNCVWNCVTPLFTPLEVQFSTNIFFKNVLLPHLKC